MGDLTRYNAANMNQLLERINRNSIGMDEYFDRLFTLHETTTNYPPYNLISVSNTESRLELALAGFKKEQVNVYTQDGKLFIEGKREDGETETNYVHRGSVYWKKVSTSSLPVRKSCSPSWPPSSRSLSSPPNNISTPESP